MDFFPIRICFITTFSSSNAENKIANYLFKVIDKNNNTFIDNFKIYFLNFRNNSDVKNEMFKHLESLNVNENSLETLNKIINAIFDSNDSTVSLEILIIDYDDNITINIKDEGKREVMRNIEKTFSQDNVKVSEVLGFNNIEFTINKG